MPTQALIIDEPWIGLIMAGQKTWEMRSRATAKRGPVALVRKGSGQIVAIAHIADCLAPLSATGMAGTFDRHCIPQAMVEGGGYKWFTPWVLADVQVLDAPVGYRHPSGAVTWVDLAPEVQTQLKNVAARHVPLVAEAPRPAGPRIEPARRAAAEPASHTPAPSTVANGIRIPLSGGNLRNGHFSLRTARHILPEDSIGGGNRDEAGKPIIVSFQPSSSIETDIAGDKMILRERGAIRAFFAATSAQEGDAVLLRRTGERAFSVRLARSTD